ncbi:MAG TPA: Rv3235 family protein [Mycobacteriales bacterium]|nr:Rv3235 family protein [Mycobacteriales bacterium]
MSLALDLPLVRPVPTLRVLPAPPCAPPYDDDAGGTPLLRLVATPPEPFELDESAWFTEDRTPTAELPEARAVSWLLLQGLVEVLAGARPLTQLRLQLDVELYAELAERLQGGRHDRGGRPDPRCVGRVHTQERPEGVAEVCAVVRRAGRLVAVAMRLEGHCGRWVCTALEGL